MQSRQAATSAARWNSRNCGPPPTTIKSSLITDAGVLRELDEMTKKLNLGHPLYKFAGGTESGRGYFCSVNINGHHAGSLDEYITQEQAQYAAALNAVNLLKTYYADKLYLPQNIHDSPMAASKHGGDCKKDSADASQHTERDAASASDDFERVVENLLILLDGTPRGIYSHALSLKYLETYKQNLPSDWLARIKDGYPEIVVDEVDTFRSIVAKRRHVKRMSKSDDEVAAVAPVRPADSVSRAESGNHQESIKNVASQNKELVTNEGISSSDKEKAISQKAKIAVRFSDKVDKRIYKRELGEEDHEIIQPPPLDHPPPFNLPEGTTRWHVFVSVVKTPADFMVRLFGEEYSEQYEQLQQEMQLFYEMKNLGRKLNDPSSADDVLYDSLLGGVYAARAEDCWHRVYLNEIIPADEGIADEGLMASVYFIDHGDYETISLDEMRTLEQKFMRLPCQATPACLAGFENFSQVEDFNQEMIDGFRNLTLGKIVAAKYEGTPGPNVGDNDAESTSAVGPLLLLLDIPVDVNAEYQKLVNIDSHSSINELMIQLAPKHSSNKIAHYGAQKASAESGRN